MSKNLSLGSLNSKILDLKIKLKNTDGTFRNAGAADQRDG